MKLIDRLKKQTTVVSNPWFRESLGGYHLCFVGFGERRVGFSGWWKTQLDYYTMGTANIPLRLRVCGGIDFLRKPQDIILFAPKVPYEEYYEKAQRFDNEWIVFRPSSSHDPLKELVHPQGYHVFQDSRDTIRNLIFEARNISSTLIGERLMAQAAFLKLLSFLLLSGKNSEASETTLSKSKPEKYSFRERVMDALTRDISADVSVEELANRLAISRSALSHKFSREIGEPFVHFKTRVKIQRAQELLKDPRKSIKEIAFETGLSDPAYFTNLFRKYTGITPGTFRKFLG